MKLEVRTMLLQEATRRVSFTLNTLAIMAPLELWMEVDGKKYPDTHRIYGSVFGARGLLGLGLIEKVGKDMYSITAKGRKYLAGDKGDVRRNSYSSRAIARLAMAMRSPGKIDRRKAYLAIGYEPGDNLDKCVTRAELAVEHAVEYLGKPLGEEVVEFWEELVRSGLLKSV